MNIQRVLTLPVDLLYIVAQTCLYTDIRRYVVLSIDAPPSQAPESLLDVPFSALVRDKDEVTLVVSQEAWAQYRGTLTVREVSPVYRLITFDVPLDFEVVGYLAVLAALLGEAEVSILTISSFSRDHIFVKDGDFGRAWKVLSDFIGACRERVATVYTDVG